MSNSAESLTSRLAQAKPGEMVKVSKEEIDQLNNSADNSTSTDMLEGRVPAPEHTGKSVNYYKVNIITTTSGGPEYMAECNDLIEALDMTYAEANVFKSVWRTAAERTLGLVKAGNDSKYDAEKAVFFAERMLVAAEVGLPRDKK